MTIVDRKMNLDQCDILNARLDQTAAVLNALSAEDQHRTIGEDNTRTVLYAVEELLGQARAAWKDLFVESE